MATIVFGPGAIGGIIAARLARQGEQVFVIARGEAHAAIAQRGLRFRSASEDWSVPVSVVSHPREISFTEQDRIILAVKTQDTPAALEALAGVAPSDTPIVCAQNGVENERMALRFFPDVYGACLYIFGTSPAPAEVWSFAGSSAIGVVDIGRYPAGIDGVTKKIGEDLRAAGFDTVVRPDIMRWKYAKLLANLNNAFDAAIGNRNLTALADLVAATRAEALACYHAAGIDYVPQAEAEERYAALLPLQEIDGELFPGGSTWQSVARGATRTEIDYLTGEISLLGRLYGVPTAVNDALAALVKWLSTEGLPAASLSPEDLRRLLDRSPGAA